MRSATSDHYRFTPLSMRPQPLLSIPFSRSRAPNLVSGSGLKTLDFGLWTYGLACQSFLFANETDSNTILGKAHMARSIAMITDTCRQPGDGEGFRAHAATRTQRIGNS